GGCTDGPRGGPPKRRSFLLGRTTRFRGIGGRGGGTPLGEGREKRGELEARRGTIRRALGQTSEDHALEPPVDVWIDVRRARRLVLEVHARHLDRRRGDERKLAGREQEQNDAARVDIALGQDRNRRG